MKSYTLTVTTTYSISAETPESVALLAKAAAPILRSTLPNEEGFHTIVEHEPEKIEVVIRRVFDNPNTTLPF